MIMTSSKIVSIETTYPNIFAKVTALPSFLFDHTIKTMPLAKANSTYPKLENIVLKLVTKEDKLGMFFEKLIVVMINVKVVIIGIIYPNIFAKIAILLSFLFDHTIKAIPPAKTKSMLARLKKIMSLHTAKEAILQNIISFPVAGKMIVMTNAKTASIEIIYPNILDKVTALPLFVFDHTIRATPLARANSALTTQKNIFLFSIKEVIP